MSDMQDYSVEQLEVGYETGNDRLLLWLPMIVTHVIDDDSPLSNWRHPEKVLSDSDATIVVVVRTSSTAICMQPMCCCHALTTWTPAVHGTCWCQESCHLLHGKQWDQGSHCLTAADCYCCGDRWKGICTQQEQTG